MNGTVRHIVALVSLTVALPLAKAGERTYTYYDLFYLACPSEGYTLLTDVNDLGVVTGVYKPEGCGQAHGFIWFNGVMLDLDDTYDGGVFQGAVGISQTGVVIAEGSPYEVLAWHNGITTPQPVPPGCEDQDRPQGINDAGTMAVGTCYRDGLPGQIVPAVYWIEEGVSLDLDLSLPDLEPDATSETVDVNDHGVVIGTIDHVQRSFSWKDGMMSEVPNGLGGEGVTVTAINNHELIVGSAEFPGGEDGYPAMSYDLNTGVMTVLGPGAAKDVNDRGVAVGEKDIDFSSEHVILYENGKEIDLHKFVPPYMTTSDGEAINNYGWIVGDGEDVDGFTRGWLLVPVYDKGDYDGDGDVDFQDSGHFQRCFAAEPYVDGTLHVGCSVFDFDDDVDLELDDYAAFQSAFTGPTAPNNNPNGPG